MSGADRDGAAAAFAAEVKRPAPPRIEPEFRVIPPDPPGDDSPTLGMRMVSPLTGQPVTGPSLGERLLAARAVEPTSFFTPQAQPGADSAIPGHEDEPSQAGRPEHLGQAGRTGQDRAAEAGSWDVPDTSERESHLRLVPPVQDDGWASPRETGRDGSGQEPTAPERAEAGNTAAVAPAYPARVFPRIFEPLEPPAEMPGLFESRKPAAPAPSLFEPVRRQLSEPPAEQHDARSAAERLSAPPADTTAPRPGDATGPQQAARPRDRQQHDLGTPRVTTWQQPEPAPRPPGWQQNDPATPRPADRQDEPAASRAWPQAGPAAQWPADQQQHDPAGQHVTDRQQPGVAGAWPAGDAQRGSDAAQPGPSRFGATPQSADAQWHEPADGAFVSGAAADQQADPHRPAAENDPSLPQERPFLPRFVVSRPENGTPATSAAPARFPGGPASDAPQPGVATPRFADGPAATETTAAQGVITPRFPAGTSPQPYAVPAADTDSPQDPGAASSPAAASGSAAQPDTLASRFASEPATTAGNPLPNLPTSPAAAGSAGSYAGPNGPGAAGTGGPATSDPAIAGDTSRSQAHGSPATPGVRPGATASPFATGPVDAPTAQNTSTSPDAGLFAGPASAEAPWQQRDEPLGSGSAAAETSWKQWDGPSADTSRPYRDTASPLGSGPAAAGATSWPETAEPATTSASSWPDAGASPFAAPDTSDVPRQQPDPFGAGSPFAADQAGTGSQWGSDGGRSSTYAPGDETVHEGVLLPPEEPRAARNSWSTPDAWGADDAWAATDDWTPTSPRSRPAREETRPAPEADDDGWAVGAVKASRQPAAPQDAPAETEPADEQKPEKRRRGLFRRRNQPPQAIPAEPVPLRDEEYVDWVSGLGDRSDD